MASPQPPSIKSQILEAITKAKARGLTCDEVEALLGRTHQTTSARISELSKAKVISNSGRLRKTTQGLQATVWIAPQFAGIDPRLQEITMLLSPLTLVMADIEKRGILTEASITIMITQGHSTTPYPINPLDLKAITDIARSED